MDLLLHPIVKGALGGLLVAARIDYEAFKGWKSFDDATAYDWKTAGFRWFRGALIGACLAGGLGSVA